MIRFEGTLSDECRVYRHKCGTRFLIFLSAILISISLLICVVIVIIYGFNSDFKEILASAGILFVLMIYLVVHYYRVKKLRYNIDIELTIDKGVITYSVPLQTLTEPIEKIKKVVKVGRCYYLVCKGGSITNSLMAEENLLKEGTIEEFELLFNGKLEIRN